MIDEPRRTVPVLRSHWRPPLQPPSAHWVAGFGSLKLQLRRPYRSGDGKPHDMSQFATRILTQIRPAFQLSGTENVTWVNAPASHLTTPWMNFGDFLQ